MAELTFLGTGTSSGVPVLGCACRVCTSADPRDKRLRTSAIVRADSGANILIDTGPDFRYQSLKHKIFRADGVLITHAHQDHIGGLDELRQLNFLMKKEVDIYGNGLALDEIRNRFDYIFKPTQEGGGKPRLRLNEVTKTFSIGELEIIPIPVLHGIIPILGYRIGDISYITDASRIPPESMKLLEGTKALVLNALRPEPHPTHFSLDEALEIAAKVGAESTYLVHMTHHFKQEEDGKKLPKNVFFAYDGLAVHTAG
jgi:phosphoribosyl 1,2-cyclic phosphate phosphodiesterase